MDQELNLKYREVEISSDEIKALVANGKELVEAPGAGYAHVPLFVTITNKYGTATYAVANTDHVVTITGLPALTDAEYQGILESTDQITKVIHGEGTSAEILEDTAINLTDAGTGEATTGDGTFIVRVVYATMNVATV